MTNDEADKLRIARANYVQQLLDLSDPLKRKVSYSIGGRSVSWTEYQTFLRESIQGIDELLQVSGADKPGAGYIVTAME